MTSLLSAAFARRLSAGLMGCVLLAAGSAEAADAVTIKVENYTFVPSDIMVTPGTTVVWVNRDDSPHAIGSTDHVLVSKAMDTDDQYSFTFDKEGDYSYFCTLHPYMTGVVKVRSP